ncbi:MAG: FAD-dependent oxidoreductase [Phycisphaerales bacterium]|nr:MAG: FAD-dependent oxidoreductase [Phycisphaerales bacterium]
MSLNRRKFLEGSMTAAGITAAGLVPTTLGGCATAPSKNISAGAVVIRKNIPIRHDVDVFVAGGGPSGLAASISAARQGRSVFLAERQNCLGGMGTAGLLPLFMQFTDGVNFLAAGIGKEVQNRLRAAEGTGPDSDRTIRAEVLKRLYDAMLLESGARFTFETRLIDVQTSSQQIRCAILAAKSGLFAVRAKIFIDCTGDGDMAVWAGAPYEIGDKDGNVMAGTLCSTWADIDWRAVDKFGRDKQEKLLPDAIKNKLFTNEDRHLPGMWRTGANLGGGNIGHTFGVDGTDERSVTEALIRARKMLLEYERYYKEYLKGFEKMELVATGSMLGIRETRRIMGDYILNLDDFKKRAVFDDEIGRYSYPVDIHSSKPGDEGYEKYAKDFKTLRYGKGENYGIPYRILVPKKLSNLLIAGRCVSTDRYMQSSIRVMPGCFITGQAAGIAAAIAVEKSTDTRGVPVAELQQRLKKIGAFLPNC